MYIGSDMGELAAFDATTGHVRWITPAIAASSGSSPAVANGVVYLTEDRVYAFDAATGDQRWVSGSIGAYNSDSPMVANGVVYIASEDGALYAFYLPG